MELDPTSFPGWLTQLRQAEQHGQGTTQPPRRYPGYPRIELPVVSRRWWTPLDRVLTDRRSALPSSEPVTPANLARLLAMSHGVTGEAWRGPTPSAGGLQALELYVGVLTPGWLEPVVYHYDRSGHALERITEMSAIEWRDLVPSLATFSNGHLLWLIVGDIQRVQPKYGPRAELFLTLEAGHLMQNLCLVSASLQRTTVPLGAFYEAAVARRMGLLPTDRILYLGLFG